MNDCSKRYPSNWSSLSQTVKDSQSIQTPLGKKVRCALCGGLFDWEQVQTHHTYYTGDNDIPGQNIFAVCGDKNDSGTCHHFLHQKGNYHYSADPVFGSYNSPELINRLRENYLLITSVQSFNQPNHFGMPNAFGYQQYPSQYTMTPNGLFNAPIINDIAPGTEPSFRFKKKLFGLTDNIDAAHTQRSKSNTFSLVFDALLIPFSLFFIVVLILVIAL